MNITGIQVQCTVKLSKNYNSYEASLAASIVVDPRGSHEEQTSELAEWVRFQCYRHLDAIMDELEVNKGDK